MKINTIAVALGALPLLAQNVIAQPHRMLPSQAASIIAKLEYLGVRHAHQNKHAKKNTGDVVVTVIDTVYASPTQAPDVLVYVNQFGVPLSTITEGIVEQVPSVWSTAYGTPPPAPSTSTTSTPPAPDTTSTSEAAPAPVAPPPSSTLVVKSSAAPVVEAAQFAATSVAAAGAPVASAAANIVGPVASAITSSAAPAQSTSSSSFSSGGGYGIAYSPYNSDNSCKTQDQVNKDFETIGKGYSRVRLYGTDCNQTATVLSAASNYGMKLFAGIFDINSLQDEVDLITGAAKGDWGMFDTISVGNELVNSASATAEAVVAAIGTVKALLKTAGWSGNVVTVDTLVASRANPSICDASSFCAVNSHPFFDGGVVAKDSGDFLTTQISTLRDVLANKNQQIVITETGWPSKGSQNNLAIPGSQNQADAISSIKNAFTSDPESVILFTAYNDYWKTNTADTYNAEQYWGFVFPSLFILRAAELLRHIESLSAPQLLNHLSEVHTNSAVDFWAMPLVVTSSQDDASSLLTIL